MTIVLLYVVEDQVIKLLVKSQYDTVDSVQSILTKGHVIRQKVSLNLHFTFSTIIYFIIL